MIAISLLAAAPAGRRSALQAHFGLAFADFVQDIDLRSLSVDGDRQ
jgi:hypothetical protein